MKNFFQLIKSLDMAHWLLLLVVGVMGSAGTFAIGHVIEKAALKSWTRQAELDVAAATISAQSWLAQSETIVSGLALGFRQPTQLTAEEFDHLVRKAEEWNSEFSLDTVAVVRRVLRPERRQVEQDLGFPLSDVNDPSKAVPDAFDYMVVTNSSKTNGPLRPGVDLLGAKEMGIVPTTAQRVPDQAIMGPAYTASDGRLYTLVGVGVHHGDSNTVVIGQVDLSEMIETLLSDRLPEGIVLRLSERDNEARADTLLHPIYGPVEAASNVVRTVTIRVTRGQARWNYNWDITDGYLGGAPTANVTMFQIGGLIITILVVYSIGLLSVQNVIIRRTVEERTRELTEEVVERKKADEIRLKSEEKLNIHLDNTPLAALAWDKNFECFEWNPAAEKIFGFSREEALGRHAFKFIVPEAVHDQVDGIFHALLSQTGGSHSINENVTKDGRKIICEWFNTPLIGNDGTPIGVSSFAQDITESHRAKQKLKESEEIFRNFYQIVPDVFTITDVDTGVYVDVNEGFCRVTGYSRSDVIGQSSSDLGIWEDGADRDKLVQRLKRKGIVNNLAANFHRKDGTTWPGIMSACEININGQPQILASTKDVSDIRRSELEAVKANKAKSEFLASMSHELRTPLTSSLGSLGLLNSLMSDRLSSEGRELLEIAIRNNGALLRLVNELLDYEKIMSGRIKIETCRHDICQLTSHIVKDNQGYARTQSVSFVFRDQLIPLFANVQEHRFEQVLNNLLSNAAKFSEPGRDVEISVEGENGEILVKVKDYGPGIPEDFKTEIFEQFTQFDSSSTRKHGGTGLGLSISKALIESMGGTLGFESEVGFGSTFFIALPASE